MKNIVAFLFVLFAFGAFAQEKSTMPPELKPVCIGDTIQASSKDGDWVLLESKDSKTFLLQCSQIGSVALWKKPFAYPQIIQGKTWLATARNEWTWFLYAPVKK